MEKNNSSRELPILEGDMTDAPSNASSSQGQTSAARVEDKTNQEVAAEQRTRDLASKTDIIDKAAAVAEDVTRKAIMKTTIDKGATSFREKLESVAKSVGINTLKGIAAYAIPKIIATVVSGAPAALGLCSRTLEDPVLAPLYAKIIKQSICDDEYLEQVNTNEFAGVRSLIMTTEQGTVTSRNTTFNLSALMSFALGMCDSRPRIVGASDFGLDVVGLNVIRFDPSAVETVRYMFIDWAQRYKDMYSGTDIGPLLRDARQFVDFYDLAVTVGAIKMLLGEPDKIKFSACEPLIKLFLYINSYYAKPVGNEAHFWRGVHLTKSANPQLDGPQYPMSRAGADIQILAHMTTISRWTSYLAASVAPPADIFRDTNAYGASVAVVPLTVAMAQNPRATALWTALFLEYPYRSPAEQYEYCDIKGQTIKGISNAPLPFQWCPDAGLVHMPGVKERVLYVLIDANVDAAAPVFGIVAQDQAAGVDIAAQLNGILNVNGANRDEMYQSANLCLKWWRTMFGSTDDWRDAMIAASDASVHTFIPTVARDANAIANPHVLVPLLGNNATLDAGISSAPTGYTAYGNPTNATPPTLVTQRITPFGGTSGTYLNRASITLRDASKPTELQYPQYSHGLGPFIAAKLFIPVNRSVGQVSVNPTQQFYAQIRLGMYMTAFTDYYRGQKGYSLAALLTNSTPGDYDQFDIYRSAVTHFVSDLFATGLTPCLNGNTLPRTAGEYTGTGDNDSFRRRTPARVLPTMVHSMLSRTEICPTDRLDVPPEAYRWRSGSVQGFSFNWLSCREKPFYDNLVEYNSYGPTTNGGALLLRPEDVISWSKVWNAGYSNNMRWYDIDLLRLPQRWNNYVELEYQGVRFTSSMLTTLPVSGFNFFSSAPGQERSITTDLVVNNQNLEAGNSIVLRDKPVHNVGATIRNTPWSNEVGVNVTFELAI